MTPTWLRHIRPYRLRETLFWRLYSRMPPVALQDIPLHFAPSVRMDLLATDVGHRQLAYCGYYELALTQAIARLAQDPGGLLVDVGANYGYFACLWAAARPDNRAIAFEASPRNIVPLQTNLVKNRLDPAVRVEPVALGHRTGTVLFAVGPAAQSGWGGVTADASAARGSIEVPMTTLAAYCTTTGIATIAVLKIDTEGADTWVRQGAEPLLQRHAVQHIFYEENPVRMQALGIPPQQARTLLQDCGYQVRRLDEGGYHAIAPAGSRG